MIKICEQNKCTGCGACDNACPKHCIKLTPSTEIGHIYPVIDQQLCTNCGLCAKICPQNNQTNLFEPMATYASWSLDKVEHQTSSSGGLASYIAKKIIEDGGIVYGCSSIFEEGKIKHVRCQSVEELERLKGSKYTQSYIENTYNLCKQDLVSGKQVLFIGVPCQIAGLKSFLGKEYEKLLTIDLVCHGVAPQQLMKEDLNLENTDTRSITFRNDKGMTLCVKDNDNVIVEKPLHKSLYYMGFLGGLYFRESCYQCQYATAKRVGDITLADFWGIDKDCLPKDRADGVSLILVNTSKGLQILDKYRDGLYLQERPFEEAYNGNRQLQHPSTKHKNTNKFAKIYIKKGFVKASKTCLFKERCKYKILELAGKINFIKSIIKKIRKK